jgi:Predicted pPIWI-associating nuclease
MRGAMSYDVLEAINKILEGFKSDHCGVDETVELLRSLFQKLPLDAQHQFFDFLQAQLFSELFSEPFSHLDPKRTAHQVIIRTWASFGPADRLPSLVFALLRSNDKKGMESWAIAIAPEFIHSLYTFRERFSAASLDVIQAQVALFTYEQSAELIGTRFPGSVVEVASRLGKAVGKIGFERFAETLKSPRPTATRAEGPPNFSPLDLKLEILRVIVQSGPRNVNKYNLLGRPPLTGDLERALGASFSDVERNVAYRAFEDLKRTSHIRPTYTDLVDPENWVIATEAGRWAVETGALDALDETLLKIAPHLVKLRRGAWAALNHGESHSLEQAAHSARELIDQVLKIGAPDEEVKGWPGYSPDTTSSSGVTRRMRLRFLTERYGGDLSETELKVSEKAADFVLAVDEKLKALAHSRIEPGQEEVESAITSAEIALKSVLTSIRKSKRAATVVSA